MDRIPNIRIKNYTGKQAYNFGKGQADEIAPDAVGIIGFGVGTGQCFLHYGANLNNMLGWANAASGFASVYFPFPLPITAVNSAGAEQDLRAFAGAAGDSFMLIYLTKEDL